MAESFHPNADQAQGLSLSDLDPTSQAIAKLNDCDVQK